MFRIEGQYKQADTTPEGGEELSVTHMLSLLDELDQEGYEQAMSELDVIRLIEVELGCRY